MLKLFKILAHSPRLIRYTLCQRKNGRGDIMTKEEKGAPDMSMDIEKQYDRIYRYCYFKLKNREAAEDITQEAFLRYLERYRFASPETALKYLYTIAKNLCIDEYRKPAAVPLPEDIPEPSGEEDRLTNLALYQALREMPSELQELLLLRYVNEVPVSVIAALCGISRFALRRRLLVATDLLRKKLREEDFS